MDIRRNGQCSRLDNWLISYSNNISACEISASLLTDHCMIRLSLLLYEKPQTSAYIWKFDNGFDKQVKALITEVKILDMSNISKWSWFKVKQAAVDIVETI